MAQSFQAAFVYKFFHRYRFGVSINI